MYCGFRLIVGQTFITCALYFTFVYCLGLHHLLLQFHTSLLCGVLAGLLVVSRFLRL